jgi:hypothetical protein
MLGFRAVPGGCAVICALAALAAFSGGAAAGQSPRGCAAAGQRVIVARSPRVVVSRITRVRSDGPERVWCADWVASGRTTKLDDGYGGTTPQTCGFGCDFAAQLQIAGRYVAYIYREWDHYDSGTDSIAEFDAQSGRMVVNAVSDNSLYDTQACVVKLVLNSRGDVAWLINDAPGFGCVAATGVYEHRPGQPTLTLDTTVQGAVGQLAISDSSLSWIADGVAHRVAS